MHLLSSYIRCQNRSRTVFWELVPWICWQYNKIRKLRWRYRSQVIIKKGCLCRWYSVPAICIWQRSMIINTSKRLREEAYYAVNALVKEMHSDGIQAWSHLGGMRLTAVLILCNGLMSATWNKDKLSIGLSLKTCKTFYVSKYRWRLSETYRPVWTKSHKRIAV